MTRAVEDVLEEIHAGSSPRMLVLNKADIIDDERRRELSFRHPDAVLVSAVTGEGLEDLRERITQEFERTLQGRGAARPVRRGRPAVRAARRRGRHGARGHARGRARHRPASPPWSPSATTATRSTAARAEPVHAAVVAAGRQRSTTTSSGATNGTTSSCAIRSPGVGHERLAPVVDQDHAQLAAVVRVDQPGRVHARDPVPERQPGARQDQPGHPRRDRDRDAGRHHRPLARREREAPPRTTGRTPRHRRGCAPARGRRDAGAGPRSEVANRPARTARSSPPWRRSARPRPG